MKVLLTGAGGYIGLHILRALLHAGNQVTALVRSPDKLGLFRQEPGLQILEGDLEDVASSAPTSEHSVCIHAAMIWGAPGSEFEMRDAAITAKLFEAAGNVGVERCIYMSSTAVHRPFSSDMSENDCIGATDVYGATKAAGELLLRAACASHKMTGIVLRPGPVVGPPAIAGGTFKSPNRIAEMVSCALKGRSIELDGEMGRQFTDISVLAEAVGTLVETESPLPTYICVDRDIIPWERVARMVVERLNTGSQVRSLNPDRTRRAPLFRTERFESLIAKPSNCKEALSEHIDYLMCMTGEQKEKAI